MNGILKTVGKTIIQNSPTLLIAGAIVGFAGAIIFAVKETPKAVALIENEEEKLSSELSDDEITVRPEDLTKKEKIKCRIKALRYYIPSVLLFAISVIMLLLSNNIASRRLTSAYAATEFAQKALITYEEKVIDIIGNKKANEIKDGIAKDILANTPKPHEDYDPNSEENPPFNGSYRNNSELGVTYTGHGKYLWLDALSGRYFRADKAWVDDTINNLNAELLASPEGVSVNSYFDYLGIDPLDFFENIGWKMRDVKNDMIRAHYTSDTTEYGEACTIITFYERNTPIYI